MYWDEIKIFVVDIFCLINGSNLGWCFAFCLLTHLIWNCVYVTLTQSFYARQKYGQVELPDWCHADPRSQHWLRFVHEEEKPSDRPVFQGSLYQGKQEKVIRCPFVGCKHGMNHCSKWLLNILVSSCIIISSNHHNIISGPDSYFQNIDSSLLYCYICQNYF